MSIHTFGCTNLVEMPGMNLPLLPQVIHGALMAAAWVLLLPLGSLVARHKWVFGEAKLWGAHLWFRLHLTLQASHVWGRRKQDMEGTDTQHIQDTAYFK